MVWLALDQKKSELKTPKIKPIFDVFPKANEISSKKKMNLNVIVDNGKVISKEGDFRI